MDQNLRNTLRSVVTQCRRLLEEAVAQVLQGQFGIYAAAKDAVQLEDAARMGHLSDEDRQYREQIIVHFHHIQALGSKPKDALAQLVREVAFTHLNRLCAYKMMECRGLIREAVSRGVKSQGFLFYLADHEADERLYHTGHQDVAYRNFLRWLGGTLSEEIGVLFSPHDPANRLFPPHRVLDDVLALINSEELKDIWTEDEAIGWVYQYFTPKELRDQARKESAAPRNSYELAFRNQFFTPRYVVEFLTDNTLGRIWYEMRKGDTALKDRCRYLVSRPTEVFLAEGEAAPATEAEGHTVSQDELLKQPAHVPHRAKKQPHELKIADPACGSAHFLLYCFDLLLVIYEEAYDDSDLGLELKKDYPTLADLRRAVPGLILRHNLYGIDIDLRATQIAALALWLRAQRAYQDMGIKKDRPKITRSNIVCAEPMPGEKDLLEGFLKTLREDRVEALIRRVMQVPADKRIRATVAMADRLCELVRLVWEKMQLAGEAGSLLKIEEELQEAIRQGQEEFEEKNPLFRVTEYSLTDQPTEHYYRFVPGDVEGELVSFWDMAGRLALAALQDYATYAANGNRLQRQLFVEDAVRGFAFVDLCRQRFDVVLMNPPFGEVSIPARSYLYSRLPETARDMFAGFVSRTVDSLEVGGLLGAITNRTAFFSDFLQQWRKRVFCGERANLACMADLGYGVLDAVVETAAYVCGRSQYENCLFLNILNATNKADALLTAVGRAATCGSAPNVNCRKVRQFLLMPDCRFAYQFHPFWIQKLNHTGEHPIFQSKAGLTTGDDFRYLRCSWELPVDEAPRKRWKWLAKGGEYSRYQTTLHLMVDWDAKDALNRTRNDELYGFVGVTYTERTTSNLSSRVLNKGSAFSGAGPGVIPCNEKDVAFLLAYLNSAIASYCLEAIVGGGDFSVKGTAARHLEPGYLQYLPSTDLTDDDRQWFAVSVDELLRSLNRFIDDETHPLFAGLTCCNSESIRALCVREYRKRFRALRESYANVRGMEARIMQTFAIPEARIADLLGDTGYPLPNSSEVEVLPDGWQEVIDGAQSDLDAVKPNGAEIQNRFENKLSHYLDLGVEKLSHQCGVAPEAICARLAENGVPPEPEIRKTVCGLLSSALGSAFGRWNVRLATGDSESPELPDPFDLLPVCSPGMLTGSDGLPAKEAPPGYSLRINWDGIIVDDADHSDDIVRRVREALELIWKDRGESIEKEACEILGVKELRDYFRKPGSGGFWDDHVKRYSKSRRKAPIYWLLQSGRKNYALWLYYHRLDKDILFKALVNYVEPEIRLEDDRLKTLRSQRAGASGRDAKQLDRQIEKQDALLSELRDFEDKLRRAANLHLEPDLNDGVILNIAPLWELVPWKEAKAYWDELLAGKYEWSSIGKQLRQKGLVR